MERAAQAAAAQTPPAVCRGPSESGPAVSAAWQSRLPLAAGASGDWGLCECWNALSPMLRRYLRRWVSAADVDDVLQSVLLELWRFQHRFDPARSLEAWALSIARKRAIDHLRAQRCRTVPFEEALPSAAAAVADGRDVANRVDDARDVRCALAQLPWPQRQAIGLAYFAGLSQREIAERLDVPLGTIKARMARGMRRMRAMLRLSKPDPGRKERRPRI